MAFNFGSSQPAFGSNAAKPTGFGTAFSSTPASTATSGFSFGTTPSFGTSQTPAFGATSQTPGFGATAQTTGFGTTAQTPGFGAAAQTPAFGATQNTAFGTPSQAPAFGATAQTPAFGAAAQTPAFGAAAQTPAFGAAAQTPGFGAVGQTPAFGATSQTPAFGGAAQAPAFGASQTPAFGATSQTSGFGSAFGTSSTPAFGSTFGAPATSAPAFGSTFGATATSAPAFGFGTSTSTSGGGLFGGSTSKPSLFGAPSTSTPSLFSTPATGTSGLFGTTTTQAPSLFGTSTTPSLFGTTTATSTPSLFGTSFGGGTTGSGLFGNANTPSSNLFGGFGSTTTAPGFTGFGGSTGFGTTGTTPSLFGGGSTLGAPFGAKPQEQANQASAADTQLQQVLCSFYAVNIFNDERDDIIKKWNMLQASWGNGKGYYGQNQQVQYSSANPLFRFKAVGYNIIIDADNSEGMVKMTFNKKESEIRSQKEAISNGISGILGNRPNLTVLIDDIRGMNESQTEVRIVVSEKGVTGTSRKIPATDLASFLNQPTQKQQLTNVGVTFICAYVTPSKSELEEYLSKPPPGIDNQMWEAAKIDNPNPKKYMPVAINGFTDLKNRMHNQEYETGLHKAFLQKVDKDIAELRKKHAASIAQITDLKQKFLQLQHRILRVLVKQECTRKLGFTIQPEEELLKGRLETLNAHLNTPTQFKGQLIELMSCIKTVGNIGRQYNEHYNIDPQVQEDIKQFLQMEQTGISHLINIINTDLQALKIISEGMNQCLKAKAPML